jgi:hypothetical protein
LETGLDEAARGEDGALLGVVVGKKRKKKKKRLGG